MFVADKFLERINVKSYDAVRAEFKQAIGEILHDFFADKPLFTNDTLSLYYYDEYALDTCILARTNNVLYLEINQPQNIKKWVKKEKRHTYPELYYSLKSLKSDLFDFCLTQFDSNTLMWVDKFGVNFSINIYDENDNVTNYNFAVVPCITYENENDIEGIMYFNEDSKDLVIEYPKLAIESFNNKNRTTLGLYKDYVVMFKNMLRLIKNERSLPSEIYETILYNVPDLFFENFSLECIQRILNYIRNSNLFNYKTLDDQDFAFVTAYRPMNIVYVKHIIKRLESYIKKIK